MRLEQLVRQLEAFEREECKELWLHSTGRKDDFEIEKIYKKYSGLFSKQSIAAVKEALDRAKGRDVLRLRFLLRSLTEGFISRALAKLTEQEARYEAKATVRVDHKAVPYRQLGILVVNEDSRKRRAALYRLGKPITKKLTAFERTAWANCYALVRELGYRDYVELYQQLNAIDYSALAAKLATFLKQTDRLFSSVMRGALKSLGLAIGQARSHDWGYLMRAKAFDAYFPKERLLPMLYQLTDGLGFPIKQERRITLDFEERPKKVPRAFCLPVSVPGNVRFMIKPHGGCGDFASALHELGHVEHFVHTSSALAFEFRLLGDYCLSESYAMLFEHLLYNPAWLCHFTLMPKKMINSFVQYGMLDRLAALRRYSAKLLYELRLHSRSYTKIDRNFRQLPNQRYRTAGICYKDILTKATKIVHDADNALIAVDSGFYCADYLRSWALEAQLRAALIARFGKAWFTSTRAGRFLKALWRHGNSLTAHELATRLGYAGVDFGPLFSELVGYFASKSAKSLQNPHS